MVVLRLCLAGQSFSLLRAVPIDCYQSIGEGFALVQNKMLMLPVCKHPEREHSVLPALFINGQLVRSHKSTRELHESDKCRLRAEPLQG